MKSILLNLCEHRNTKSKNSIVVNERMELAENRVTRTLGVRNEFKGRILGCSSFDSVLWNIVTLVKGLSNK